MASPVQQTVQVELGDRSYPIVFKGLRDLGSTLAELRGAGKCVLVSNSVVGPLYKDVVRGSLEAAGWNVEYIELPDGEAKKTPETYLWLVNQLLDLSVDRKAPVIALGGGVTTDIVGFAAATTLRGLPFCNVPTTLLAQVDASVGGKTGVNTPHGKNLLGAFWQPFIVYVAVETLTTLSDPEYRCGLGEVVKHAVLEEVPDASDPLKLVPSTVFMEWLEANAAALVSREPAALAHTIRRCCEIKAAVVSADERESGKRALLNLGHTVGHAIEAVAGYGALRHGEAVGIGTVAEAQVAEKRGLCGPELPARIARLLRALRLPTGIKGLAPDALLQASLMDKKREQSHISVTMPYAIGDVRLTKMLPEELMPAYEALEANADRAFGEAAAKPDNAAAAVPAAASEAAPEPPASTTPSANAFASGSNQNAGNVLTGRPTTRVRQPPGGSSSIFFG